MLGTGSKGGDAGGQEKGAVGLHANARVSAGSRGSGEKKISGVMLDWRSCAD